MIIILGTPSSNGGKIETLLSQIICCSNVVIIKKKMCMYNMRILRSWLSIFCMRVNTYLNVKVPFCKLQCFRW